MGKGAARSSLGGGGRRQSCGGESGGGEKYGGPAQARHRYGGSFRSRYQKGHVIIAHSAKTGESEPHLQDRLRAAMSRVRQASPHGGQWTTRPKAPFWLNFSSLPDRRKRAILAGKIKRAVIESGRAKDQLEVELAKSIS